MKKNLFWKITAIFFLVWLFLFVWIFSIQIDLYKERLIVVKTNKITGKVQYMRIFEDDDWNEPGYIKK